MPFTLAHPAVVLPLRRTGLPMTALVAGSMVPDARLFVPGLGTYDVSHSPVGIVTVDLALALVALVLWTWVVRDVLVDVAPTLVRERLDPRARLTRTGWALAVPAVVVGSATHVGWDELTHDDRWGTRHVAWLREEHGVWPGYTWAQAASGVVGLVVVTWAVLLWWRGRPRTPWTVPRLLPRWTLAALVAVPVAGGLVAGVERLPAGIEAAAFRWVVSTMRVALVTLAVTCAAWLLLRARRRQEVGREPS